MIEEVSFYLQKNDPPFQLKLPPKATKSEKEIDPEYEEKMVNLLLGFFACGVFC